MKRNMQVVEGKNMHTYKVAPRNFLEKSLWLPQRNIMLCTMILGNLLWRQGPLKAGLRNEKCGFVWEECVWIDIVNTWLPTSNNYLGTISTNSTFKGYRYCSLGPRIKVPIQKWQTQTLRYWIFSYKKKYKIYSGMGCCSKVLGSNWGEEGLGYMKQIIESSLYKHMQMKHKEQWTGCWWCGRSERLWIYDCQGTESKWYENVYF